MLWYSVQPEAMWKVFGSYENVLRLTLQDYEAPQQQYAREIMALK